MTPADNSLEVMKLKIKEWEHSFLKEYNKKPLKNDIKQAPDNIRELYKNYWKFKSAKPVLAHDQEKDSVWSPRLNKANQAVYGSSSNQNIVQGYCEKLKKRTIGETSLPLKQHLKIAKPFPTCTENYDNFYAKINSSANSQSVAVENSASTELKIFNVTNITNPLIKQINVLPSTRNKSYCQNNINEDWLKRCFKGETEVLVGDKHSCEFPLQKFEASSTITSNENFDSTLYNNASNISVIVNQGKNSPAVENSFPEEHNSGKGIEEILPSYQREISETCKSCPEKHENVSVVEEGLSKLEKNNPTVYQSTKAGGHKRFRSPSAEDCLSNISQFAKSVSSSLSNISGISVPSDISLDFFTLDRMSKTTVESEENFKKFKLSQNVGNDMNLKKISHLTKKITSGTLNENFIRVNIKRKHFARGHHKINVKKMKWQKWKQTKKDSRCTSSMSVAITNCFKCGEAGHWAYKCPLNKKRHSSDSDDAFEIPLPTLEEAEALYKGSPLVSKNKIATKEVKVYCTEKQSSGVNSISFNANPSDNMEILKFSTQSVECCKTEISPLFSEDRLTDIPQEVFNGLKQLGYSKFREGQDRAIMRVLCGLSTVVILPTGAGKSLCYQLPAYLYAQKYKCITLVISPLVSLMEDQMRNVSSHLHVVSLHGNLTSEEKKKCLTSISDGTAKILLVSPETIIGGKGYLPADLPPIAFACIDEVHCLSEWSHNFRPSYLRIYKVLKEKYGIGCVLGLTATATKATLTDLSHRLDLNICGDSIIGNTATVPYNLHLSVSQDIDKDWALIKLLQGDRFKQCSSIIIYCIRREETERISALIRTCMQNEETIEVKNEYQNKKYRSNRHGLTWTTEAYHAGLVASKRRSIQKKFMSGKLRVIVATIAFGMGLNKPDVRAVIHYNMPKSFESYVQEIGRAGRDGVDSHCHLFLHPENQDLYELKRHIYSNGIDRITIKKLLKKIFIPCKCPKTQLGLDLNVLKENSTNENLHSQNVCPKHELVFSIEDSVQELDLKEENILTLLCYLELHPERWIEQLPPTYATCLIRCYGGPNQLRQLAQKYPIVAMALAYGKLSRKEWDGSSSYEFQIIDLASHMSLESGHLKRELKALEWNDQNRKSGVLVEFSTLSFHLLAPGNLTDDNLDFILDFLFRRVNTQEKSELEKLEKLISVFQRFSHLHYWSCNDEVDETKSNAIKEEIKNHFEKNGLINLKETSIDNNLDIGSIDSLPWKSLEPTALEQVKADIQDVINTNHDRNFTARAIARIFHGIGSPCYPAEVWGRVQKFWRCHLNVDFHIILKMANDIFKKGYQF